MLSTCRIKFPPDLLEAAAHAARVNPNNEVPLLPELAPADVFEPMRLAVLTSKYWGPRDRTLTVQFMDTQDAALRQKILSHMNAWYLGGSCVQFTLTNDVGDIRITRDHGDGYWSYLGTDTGLIPDNEATMNLAAFTLSTSDATYNRVVRHETGHTLGFAHEQLRPEVVSRVDEQLALTYFRQTQGWDDATIRRNVLTPLDPAKINATPTADLNSVMCYSLPASIMKDRVAVPGGANISAMDQGKCNELYPRATVPPPPPPTVSVWCRLFGWFCPKGQAK
jgi:hypothetical protein